MLSHIGKVALGLVVVVLVLGVTVPSYAQSEEYVISLAHHSNVECTASINGISTRGLVAESSGSARAQGGVCHIGVDEPVNIVLTGPINAGSLKIEGLKDDSIATYYDINGQVVGTYTKATGYVAELGHLSLTRIVISNIGTLLVKNGSFEATGEVHSGGIVVNANNANEIPAWEWVSGSLDWFGPDSVVAADGVRSVDVSGSGMGSLRQVINTVPGQAYVLRFAISGDPNGGLPEKRLQVNVPGVEEVFTYILSSENSTTNMLWHYQTVAFVAESESSEIRFTSLVDNWYGPTIDNVSVREGALCSASSSEELTVEFINHLDEEVSFHWMDFDCVEGGGPVLAPNASDTGTSFTGHIFIIRGADGRIIGQYVADPSQTTIIVGAE